jgi:hypothetical protein
MDFLLGLVASLVAWGAVTWCLTPRLEGSHVNRHPDASIPERVRYRIKVRNASWFWPVGDLQLAARFVIVGLDSRNPQSRTSLVLPVANGEVFPALMRAGPPWYRHHHFRYDAERSFTLRSGELSGNGIRRLPVDLRHRLHRLTLDELMNELQLRGAAVSATHGRSGLRRTLSLRAAVADFQTGDFEPGRVHIVPSSAELADGPPVRLSDV